MKDIQIINHTIVFRKKLWHASEIVLARCFNFDVDVDGGIITCNIERVSKRALYEFIGLSFRSFNESVVYEQDRHAFYQKLDEIYSHLDSIVDEQMQRYLPYYGMLYFHQKDTLKESYRRQYNFFALDMGLGKTLTAASVSRIHQVERTVILCPAAVKWNWFRDLTSKFGFNELFFTILDTSKRRSIRGIRERFVIVNYDITGKFRDEITKEPIGHFILDEAHGLKNHNSLRYKNVYALVEKNPNARITFLSGTPVKNRVDDVFAYLKLIGHELAKSQKKFKDEYTIRAAGRGGERVTGGKNLQDLYIKMSNFMIRKRKDECLDLPEKVFLSYKYEMDDYRDEYDKIIQELSQIKELTSLTGNLHSLNIITSKAKLSGIKELLDEMASSDRKVVVFGSYKEPLNELEVYFGESCVKVDGSVPAYERDQRVQRFWNDDGCKIFLGNMVAAGVGINLTNASDVLFLNFPLTPAELYQAIDRCHRIGQGKSVNIHYTFCENSIDEYIYDIIVDKELDINALIDKGKEVMFRENFTEILIKKLLNREVENTDIALPEVQQEEKSANIVIKSQNGTTTTFVPIPQFNDLPDFN